MADSDRGQVNRSAAEVYEAFFVPALFEEWAVRLIDAAHIQPEQRILDVACGTGIVARHAVSRGASVVGVDLNAGMLAVATQKAPQIDWREGNAEALPFDDGSFDAVVSQFGLMFFTDRIAAIREMYRVLKPGGHLAIAVWDALEHSPGYDALMQLLLRLFGDEAADALRAPYVLGDVDHLAALVREAKIGAFEIQTLPGRARFASIDDWMYTEIKGWVLADRLDDDQFTRLLNEAKSALASFVNAEGKVEFASPAHVITAVKA